MNLMELLGLMQSGGNPTALLQQMFGNDPRAAQAMRMLQGKSPAQLKQIAENMAQQRGISLAQLAAQFGIKM